MYENAYLKQTFAVVAESTTIASSASEVLAESVAESVTESTTIASTSDEVLAEVVVLADVVVLVAVVVAVVGTSRSIRSTSSLTLAC